MNIEDYIKEAEGQRVYITRKGMQLANKAITLKGGGKKFAEFVGVHENTISNFRTNGFCSIDTWQIIFGVIAVKEVA